MVAGKMRAAMGLQKSPKAADSPKPPPKVQAKPNSTPSSNRKPTGVFSRSLAGYLPRSAAQVRPRPPDTSELLLAVEVLQVRNSRFAAEVSYKEDELRRSRQQINNLEAENKALQVELEQLQHKAEKCQQMEKRNNELEDVITSMKLALPRRQSSRTEESCLLKIVKKNPKPNCTEANPKTCEPTPGDQKVVEENGETKKARVARIPNPPPNPSPSCSSSSSNSSDSSISITRARTIPPPVTGGEMQIPPPPPPPPARGAAPTAARMIRVPEVAELYHYLMRRGSRRESSGAAVTAIASNRDMIGEIENRSAHLLAIKMDVETQGDLIRFLINEVNNVAFTNIEDVVRFVKWLDDELSFLVDERAVLKHFDWPEKKADAMREAAFGYSDMKKLELEAVAFRDECQQPCVPSPKKMQALLEKLEHGVYGLARVRDSATKRYKGFRIPCEWMQENGLVGQIKLASVKLARIYMRRVSSELETARGGHEEEELLLQGVRFAFRVHQIKLASVKLARKYMRRVSSELEAARDSLEEEELLLQGVRFAFRVHQFAGGFNIETMWEFQALQNKAFSFHIGSDDQNHY